MTQIFSALPGLSAIPAYAYHFCVMFEALFVLTTIDTGTRVGRFLLQELAGRLNPKLGRPDWLPGSIVATCLIVGAWAAFIHSGSVSTIWPMFGIANQLLAVIGLAVGTTVIVNSGKRHLAWVTLMPMSFVAVATLSAGYLSIVDNFLPLARTKPVQGYLNAAITVLVMTGVVVILGDALLRWTGVLRRSSPAAAPAPG
jgi:carbon starvation protein